MKKPGYNQKESNIIKILFQNLLDAELHTFPVKGKIKVTDKQGVYIIYDPDDIVLHVGNTPSGIKGLNQRLYNHITKNGVLYKKHLNPNNIEMRGTHKFRCLEVKDPRHRALLESYAIGSLCPVHFGTGEKNKNKPNSQINNIFHPID